FFFSSRRRHTRWPRDWSSDVCSSDLGRYFDVLAEYAKVAPDDILIRITVANRGAEAARLHLLPTLWFRNTWSWGSAYEESRWPRSEERRVGKECRCRWARYH